MKKMTKKIENRVIGEQCITLVSLTVTVIVLLVLAGIPILLFGGENNIIARAFSAKKIWKILE